MELDDMHKKILALCADDDTGLWFVIKKIAKDAYSFEMVPVWVRQKTIEVIQYLMEGGLIEAGNPNGPEFQKLSSSVTEAIAHIESEWDLLGKTPNIGDICWFRATPAGEQLARELNLRA